MKRLLTLAVLRTENWWRRVLVVPAALLLAATAWGTPFWFQYNAADGNFPEAEGWNRVHSDPPPHRSLQNGKLFIDSREPWGLWEGYGRLLPGMMTPGPGETFVMSWRARVDEVTFGYTDQATTAQADDQYTVTFDLAVDGIHSLYEPGKWAPFTPWVFHEFRLESNNMRSYTLSIDGVPSLQGTFFESLFDTPGGAWGDGSTARSLVEWDWVGFGMVPEPGTAMCLLLLIGLRRRSNGSSVNATAHVVGGHES